MGCVPQDAEYGGLDAHPTRETEAPLSSFVQHKLRQVREAV
jgi:hypothetical protein